MKRFCLWLQLFNVQARLVLVLQLLEDKKEIGVIDKRFRRAKCPHSGLTSPKRRHFLLFANLYTPFSNPVLKLVDQKSAQECDTNL